MMRCLLTAAGILATAASVDSQSKELVALQEAVRKIIDDNEPSVACILVSRSERYRDFGTPVSSQPGKLGTFDAKNELSRINLEQGRKELLRRLDLSSPDPLPESYGSGVVVDAGALILTHYHVVRDATKVFVRLPNRKGSYADIIAADGRSDLAVLKLINPPPDLKAVRFGDGDKVRKGDFVVGLANPYAAGIRDGGSTASHGIVGSLQRKSPTSAAENDRSRTLYLHNLGTLLQTDLRLSLGCSGGGVFNLDGEMIGLTTSMSAVVGGETPGGFSIPMTPGIKRIIDVLKRGQEVEYGFLGVGFGNRDGIDRDGAIVDQISEGTPAQRAGLKKFDVILAVNEQAVQDYDDLSLHIGTALAGSEVVLTVRSVGETRKVLVKLAKFNYPGPVIAANRPATVHGLRVDYNSVVTAEIPIPEGVAIREFDPGSAAERKYKDVLERTRWIITHVNKKPVSTPADFYRESGSAKGALELRIVEVVKNPDSTARTITFP
jgi:serine protease Do